MNDSNNQMICSKLNSCFKINNYKDLVYLEDAKKINSIINNVKSFYTRNNDLRYEFSYYIEANYNNKPFVFFNSKYEEVYYGGCEFNRFKTRFIGEWIVINLNINTPDIDIYTKHFSNSSRKDLLFKSDLKKIKNDKYKVYLKKTDNVNLELLNIFDKIYESLKYQMMFSIRNNELYIALDTGKLFFNNISEIDNEIRIIKQIVESFM